MLLAGDIGGTKTHLAIYAPERGPRAPLHEATFRSADYAGLEQIIRAFLAPIDGAIDRATFGVAGPVIGGHATITNLPWVIERDFLRDALGIDAVDLLNDLAAIANSVPFLTDDELHTLYPREPEPGGAIAVIAPGTGLGEAFLTWDGRHYLPHASEGGHTDFAPTNSLEDDLLRYLRKQVDHVSYERVCSGIGLSNIYAFFKQTGRAVEPDWLAADLAETDDPNPVIVGNALDAERACTICRATLDTFVSVLGAEAGNLALKVFATGGVYLGGGIPPRILPALESGQFIASFLSKGRFSDLLSRVPVHVILNPRAALLGAACYGLEL